MLLIADFAIFLIRHAKNKARFPHLNTAFGESLIYGFFRGVPSPLGVALGAVALRASVLNSPLVLPLTLANLAFTVIRITDLVRMMTSGGIGISLDEKGDEI